ncbi:MAG: FAD:protein FMN transferase [Paludibacter sp.]|nr:FAD:protein FMN transferase [Paludibacter sp.]
MKNFKRVTFSVLSVLLFASCAKQSKKSVDYIHNEGKAQGTYYSATYLQPDGKDLQVEIDSFFMRFDRSLSTYNPNSVISKINKNQSTETDLYFENMFAAAYKVSVKTNGAFDITVAPLVNAWGFGFGKQERNKEPDYKSLMNLIGYEKVKLVDHQIIKSNPEMMLDASAIAQGYSADLVATLFEDNGCENYMIDIGGEIVCKGKNPKGKNWQIGIDKPVDDPVNQNGELQTIVSISNKSITTSGNYRQFYFKDGKKYAHTINPKTGRPVEHNLLSATVVADNCTTADAYATAFMVMGKDSAMALCNRMPEMDCYLIYADDQGKYQVVYTDGFKKYLSE